MKQTIVSVARNVTGDANKPHEMEQRHGTRVCAGANIEVDKDGHSTMTTGDDIMRVYSSLHPCQLVFKMLQTPRLGTKVLSKVTGRYAIHSTANTAGLQVRKNLLDGPLQCLSSTQKDIASKTSISPFDGTGSIA